MLRILACPGCGGSLSLASGSVSRNAQVWQGELKCDRCSAPYPVANGIPRFTSSDGYASSFSFEWSRFARTQLDSARRCSESESRFRESLDFPPEALRGKVVLDAGCGMGRFAEIAAGYGATVVAVDLSYAVDVAAENLARFEAVHPVQADLRSLPFHESSFDFVYSLGVLHHTPNPREAFANLVRYLKGGGKISITVYSGYNKVYVASTRFWRRLTTRLPKKLVYYLSHWAIPAYYLYRIPIVGLVGRALLPISVHRDPEWRLLDTFDCYTPVYQSYHSHPEVFRWFRDAGLIDIAVLAPGISFVGTKVE